MNEEKRQEINRKYSRRLLTLAAATLLGFGVSSVKYFSVTSTRNIPEQPEIVRTYQNAQTTLSLIESARYSVPSYQPEHLRQSFEEAFPNQSKLDKLAKEVQADIVKIKGDEEFRKYNNQVAQYQSKFNRATKICLGESVGMLGLFMLGERILKRRKEEEKAKRAESSLG